MPWKICGEPDCGGFCYNEDESKEYLDEEVYIKYTDNKYYVMISNYGCTCMVEVEEQ